VVTLRGRGRRQTVKSPLGSRFVFHALGRIHRLKKKACSP